MLVVFSPIFMVDAKRNFRYDFVAPLIFWEGKTLTPTGLEPRTT